jgi:SNF2 family DNA or RNA helicase
MYLVRDVELTAQQKTYYEKIRTQMLFEAVGEEVTAVNAAVQIQKLLQISGGAVYSDDRMILEFDVSKRLNALEEIINETSNKIIVFIPYRHTIQIIHSYLNKLGVSNELIHGDVSLSQRTDIFSRFQTQEDPKVLLVQPQAASHGVTLTAADTVVFWSPVMSVETYLQCIARIDRVGQKNRMTVHHIQGSAIERRIYKALMEKKNLHEELTEMYRDIVSK